MRLGSPNCGDEYMEKVENGYRSWTPKLTPA
jgi:hypothetical protein